MPGIQCQQHTTPQRLAAAVSHNVSLCTGLFMQICHTTGLPGMQCTRHVSICWHVVCLSSWAPWQVAAQAACVVHPALAMRVCQCAARPLTRQCAVRIVCVDALERMQEADEKTAIQTIHAAYAAGINFFDVSPYYGSGRAEQVGACLYLSLLQLGQSNDADLVKCLASTASVTCHGTVSGHHNSEPCMMCPAAAWVCSCMQLLGAAIKSLPRDDLIIYTKIGKYAPGGLKPQQGVAFKGDSALWSFNELRAPLLPITFVAFNQCCVQRQWRPTALGLAHTHVANLNCTQQVAMARQEAAPVLP